MRSSKPITKNIAQKGMAKSDIGFMTLNTLKLEYFLLLHILVNLTPTLQKIVEDINSMFAYSKQIINNYVFNIPTSCTFV